MARFTDEELMQMRLPAGIYEHYKSTPEDRKLYHFFGLQRHTETEELGACYIPLYHNPNHKGPALQFRPAGMFFEEITGPDEKPLDRFTWVGNGR